MAALISQFINHIAQSFTTQNAQNLVASIPLDRSHPFFNPLSEALSSIPGSSIDKQSVSSQLNGVASDVRDTLASLLVAVLQNAKGENGGSSSHSAAKEYDDFQRLVLVYTEANKLYGVLSPDGGYAHPFLNPVIVALARTLARLASKAAATSSLPLRHTQSARSIRDTCRLLIERSNQIATSNMNETEWGDVVGQSHVVGDIMWSLSNILWRIYAERNLHTQSTELQKSLSSLLPREEKRLTARGRFISQTDVCQSYYWRGRLGVVLLDMRNAKYWLDKAWSFCPENAWKQRRSLLIRLIPVNLLLGRLPSQALLSTYDLTNEFGPLIHAHRKGNLPAWRKILSSQREWFRKRSIWLILFERGEILVWRNLLRNSLKEYYRLNPGATKGRCPTLVFLIAAQNAFEGSGEIEEGAVQLTDLICVIASLIDQGFILGILAYSQQYLAMKMSQDGMGGFPRISQVVPRRVEAIA